MALHSQSCVRNSQGLVWRRLRRVYSLISRYDSSSQTFKLISLWVMTRRQRLMPFDTSRLVFIGNVKAVNFRKHVEDLITSYEKLGCMQHVIQDAFSPFTLGFLSTWLWCRKWRPWLAFSPGYLNDREQIQGQMECCQDSRLLLDGEKGCSGYSVQEISETAPRLIRVYWLLCPASYSNMKVKWSRYRPGEAQRVGRGITLLFHDNGTRRGWVVSILQEAGWAPGPVWTGRKSRPHRDSILDRPARSSVAIQTELPGPLIQQYTCNNSFLNQSQSHILNASLIFCIANSTSETYFSFRNRTQLKICCKCNVGGHVLPPLLTSVCNHKRKNEYKQPDDLMLTRCT